MPAVQGQWLRMTCHFKQLMEDKPMESFLIPQLYLYREGLKGLVWSWIRDQWDASLCPCQRYFFSSFHSLKKKKNGSFIDV